MELSEAERGGRAQGSAIERRTEHLIEVRFALIGTGERRVILDRLADQISEQVRAEVGGADGREGPSLADDQLRIGLEPTRRVERLEMMRAQIRALAHFAAVLADEAVADPEIRGTGYDFARAMWGKLQRLCNIAEAGSPDRAWPGSSRAPAALGETPIADAGGDALALGDHDPGWRR